MLKHVFKTCDVSIERELIIGIGIRAGDKKIVLNKRGGYGVPKIIKRCVFGLKNRLFRQKLTRRVLNVPRGWGRGHWFRNHASL